MDYVVARVMGDDSSGAATSLSIIQLKPQPINNIRNNVHEKLITSPKSPPKSNYTISNNNVLNIDSK